MTELRGLTVGTHSQNRDKQELEVPHARETSSSNKHDDNVTGLSGQVT